MKHISTLSAITLAIVLSACGGSSSSSKTESTPEPTPTPAPDPQPTATQFGPFATGTSAAPETVYFDLDTGEVVTLTAEQAVTNSDWDVAFSRTKVFLNQHEENKVLVHFSGNNADFYDQDGKAVNDQFINATAETELEDYEAVKHENIPADETAFSADETKEILEGFYNYNTTTHQVTAADDKYFIVNANSAYTKFRVSDLTQNAFVMSDITFAYGRQTESDTEFSAEQELTLDLALLCGDADKVYVDFSAGMEVAEGEAYDVSIPCADGGADFDINLHADATAIQDFDNAHAGIAPQSARFLGFQSNEFSIAAFDKNPWYAYNLEGGHKLWSQYGVYIIKNANGHFKLQVTSYYDEDGNSGNYTFRADALTAQ